MEPKLCLAICNNFIMEFDKIISDEELDMVKVIGLPCSCVQGRCRKSLYNVSDLVKPEKCDEIQWLQCGGIGNSPEHETTKGGVRIVHNVLNSCFGLFTNEEIIAAHLGDGAYLTTPGWVVNWPHQLENWGFDQNTAQEFFKEFAKKIVLLDTGVLPGAQQKCREFAQYVNLTCEIQNVGLDHCTLKMKDIVRNWELEQNRRKVQKLEKALARQNADLSTIFDFLAELTSQNDENSVAETIATIFSVLFSPENLIICTMQNGEFMFKKSFLVCRLAIDNSRALRGVLPICSYCKKIREPGGKWQQMEVYISDHSQALFSHTYCENCAVKHYDELME